MAVIRTSARGTVGDPYLSFRFRAEIDGLQISGFNEVTGLSFETEVESLREGGVNTHELQLAGPTKFPTKLILKRGLADADALWSWYRAVMDGSIERKKITITLHDHGDEERWRWVFKDACPVKWSGPDFRASTAEIAFESIELIHKGLEFGASPPSGRKSS